MANSSSHSKSAYQFLAKFFSNNDFMSWLNKMCFYANLQDFAFEMYTTVVIEDNIPILMNRNLKPIGIIEYLENWRLKLWENEFVTHFRGVKAYVRSVPFKDQVNIESAVKRAIY